MKINFRLKIKSRNQPQWLCWLLIIMPFLFGTMTELMKIPPMIKYLLDVAWFAMLLMMIRMKLQDPKRKAIALTAWTSAFFFYTLLSYVFLYQSPLFYLWGVRNNFRYYVAFAAFCTFLEPEDVNDYFKLFDKLFWVNIIVSLVQYFVLGKRGDFLGGIFGVTHGCNGYSNIFFVIVLTKSVVFYMEKRERLQDCFLKFAAVVVVSALAELKFFFAEAMIIIGLAALFTNFSWRKVGIVFGGIIGLSAGAALLAVVFPGFADFFSLDYFFGTATSDRGYTGRGDMNRMTVIPIVNKKFLTEPLQQLFGFGLGNCDYSSSFAFLTSPFFARYSRWHYTWLSTAFMYLETGWIGLTFFFGFFVLAFRHARRIERNCRGIAKTYCRIAKIMAIMCIVIAIYNSSLRTEAGYMAYFTLAVPSIVAKAKPKEITV